MEGQAVGLVDSDTNTGHYKLEKAAEVHSGCVVFRATRSIKQVSLPPYNPRGFDAAIDNASARHVKGSVASGVSSLSAAQLRVDLEERARAATTAKNMLNAAKDSIEKRAHCQGNSSFAPRGVMGVSICEHADVSSCRLLEFHHVLLERVVSMLDSAHRSSVRLNLSGGETAWVFRENRVFSWQGIPGRRKRLARTSQDVKLLIIVGHLSHTSLDEAFQQMEQQLEPVMDWTRSEVSKTARSEDAFAVTATFGCRMEPILAGDVVMLDYSAFSSKGKRAFEWARDHLPGFGMNVQYPVVSYVSEHAALESIMTSYDCLDPLGRQLGLRSMLGRLLTFFMKLVTVFVEDLLRDVPQLLSVPRDLLHPLNRQGVRVGTTRSHSCS